jgi:large subunit ribosomal protein L13
MIRQTHKINATDKVLGRLSSEIAVLLQGKGKVGYRPNVDAGDFVEVSGVAGLKFTGKKLTQKIYYRHSLHLGGLREEKLKEKMAINPAFVLRHAVYGMLPVNKLRDKMIKRLKFV